MKTFCTIAIIVALMSAVGVVVDPELTSRIWVGILDWLTQVPSWTWAALVTFVGFAVFCR